MVLLAANPNSTGTYKYHSRPSPNTQLEETQIYDLLSALCKSLKSYRDKLPSCAREKQVDTGAQNQMGCPYGIWSKSPKTVPYNFSSKNLGITLLLLLPKRLNTRMGGWENVPHLQKIHWPVKSTQTSVFGSNGAGVGGKNFLSPSPGWHWLSK